MRLDWPYYCYYFLLYSLSFAVKREMAVFFLARGDLSSSRESCVS